VCWWWDSSSSATAELRVPPTRSLLHVRLLLLLRLRSPSALVELLLVLLRGAGLRLYDWDS
jgi:hypothetical protein